MTFPAGHPFSPPTSRFPAPTGGPVYPRNPLQDSIDRIRAAQQQPQQPQPQFGAEDVLIATGDMQHGLEQEAARRAAAAAEEQARQQAEARAKQKAEHDQRMSGRWGPVFEHTPVQDAWDSSLRRGERIKGEKEAANQQAWMNQQINEQELPPIAGLDNDPVVSADPAYAVDQTDAVKRMQQQAADQMTAPTGEGSDVTVQPMPESSSGPMIPPSPRRQAAAERRQKNSGWTDPASAPLPGEETLPPAVAEWNQARASSGSGSGTDALRMAYDIAEKNVPSGMTFDEWVSAQMEAHGVDFRSHPMEAQAALEKIVSQNLHEYGHDPMGEGIKHDPRIDRDDDSVLSGRRGLADGTPLDLMSPEQRARVGQHYDGSPRTARGGMYVWDQTEGPSGQFVPRAFDPKAIAAARNSGDIRQEAAAYGIDHMAYGDNTAQLEADVAVARNRHDRLSKTNDAVPVAGGGMRYKRNRYGQGLDDSRRAAQFGQDIAKTWAHELKQNNIAVQDVVGTYREYLAKNPGDYAGAARAVDSRYLNTFRLTRTQDRNLAVRQRNMQDARAARYGVSPGLVSFFDSLQDAKTPEERQAILMFAHGAQPQMGWNSLAAMYAQGQFDSESLSQWAAQMSGRNQTPADKVSDQMERIQNGDLGMEGWAQITMHTASIPGNEKDPRARAAEARRIATPLIQQRLATGAPLSHDNLAFIRAATQNDPNSPADAEVFSQVTGIPQNDPRFVPLYQQVFGTPPASGWLGNLVAGAGWLGRALSGNGGGNQGIDPSAFAGPASQGQ